MYILRCSDGSYYTGSTKDLIKRMEAHQSGKGSNHTRKFGPVVLIYYEEFDRIDFAFEREKQIQGWSRKKKEALIDSRKNELKLLAQCRNHSHCNFKKNSFSKRD
jgi:putative endonuclease